MVIVVDALMVVVLERGGCGGGGNDEDAKCYVWGKWGYKLELVFFLSEKTVSPLLQCSENPRSAER
ncbi:hypothetical protein HanRHA438_Chr17g0836561 [Helianthus annuus]|nr:hypothetical protein HanRHA438_Chr17g0836561 [Helianthus annuus]